MAPSFGQFGNIALSGYLNPQSLSFDDGFGWNERSRLSGKPVLEVAPNKLRSYKLAWQIHQSMGIDPDSYAIKWKTLADEKKPQPLTINEQYLGEFVIEAIRVQVKSAADDGRSIALQFSVDLLESVGIKGDTPPQRPSSFRRKNPRRARG